jgi:hypothetical protein
MFSGLAKNRAVQQQAGSYAAQAAQSDHMQQHMAQGVASAYPHGGAVRTMRHSAQPTSCVALS